jgi:phosphatidylglycerol:prolipoprotein diacylglycerol transferase
MMETLKSGIFSLHGFFVATAIILMILYAFYYMMRKNYDHVILMYITPAAVFFGFAGARLMYVTICDQLYVDAADKWRFTDGGYALFGAAAGVILTVIVFWLITKRKFRLLPVFDTLCAAAPAAIALGRLGSVFSQDCLGSFVEKEGLRFFPIAIFKQADGGYHYAVFFYEAVFCVILFFFIRYADKTIGRAGVSSFLFTSLYCSARAFLEGLREDSMRLGFVRINQVIAILAVIGLFVYICIRLFKRTKFKWKYLILYGAFTAAFVCAFFSEFYMYSESRAWNTVQILICCIIMAASCIIAGIEYLRNTSIKQDNNGKQTAKSRKIILQGKEK